MQDKNEYQLEEWFRALIQKARTLQSHPAELLAIDMGLRYLYTEARAQRSRRDHDGIKRTWLKLHPHLEKGFLLQSKSDAQLRSRLTFFIQNGFGVLQK